MNKFESEVRLAREMTTLDATLIGVGAMIGAGIFVLIGIAAGVAGPGLIVAFILNGLIALLTAMSYAELGSCFHDAGGGYLWVKEGLPHWNGFISGWMSWFAHAVACSLYALGFGAYFQHVLAEFNLSMPGLGFLSPQKILAASTAILFAYVNFRGASETGKIGNLVTLTKIIILLIFIGFGIELILRKGDWQATFSPFFPHGAGGVFRAMGLAFIAFQGFEVIAQSSEEIKNPRKNIPRAVFLSLLIVIPIYILVAFVAIGTVSPHGLTPWDYLAKQKETALVNVARNFFTGGGILILIGGLISTISALNATIYSSSRVAFAMGRDRNFPSFFSKIHPKNQTPHRSIMVSLIIIIIMSISLPIEDVASSADIMFLLLFLQVNIAMIRLRKRRKDLDRGYKVPLFPYLSIAGILLLLFLAIYMVNYSLTAWIVTIVWIASGLLFYKLYASHREVEHAKKVATLERLTRKDYTILVCLSLTDNIKSLSELSFAIAKKHGAEVIFLHVVELAEEDKLRKGLQFTDEAMVVLDHARNLSEAAGVKSRSIIKVSHRISSGIAETVVEEDCNFIITGRNKGYNFVARLFGSAIDLVLQRTTNEAAILHGEISPEKLRNILIPYNGDINTRFALETVPALSEYFNARVSIGVVFDPETESNEKLSISESIRNILTENSFVADIKTVTDPDTLHGVLNLSSEADLIVMGGKSGDFIELLFASSLTREITEKAKCPVLWLKEFEEREPFLKSLFKSIKK